MSEALPVDTATLTETIREALTRFGSGQSGNRPNQRFVTDAERSEVALAALSSLETRLEEVTEERDAIVAKWGWLTTADERALDEACARAVAAEAREANWERQAGESAREADALQDVNSELRELLELAEAREKALSDGIQELAETFGEYGFTSASLPACKRLTALVGVRGEEKEQDKPKERL